MQPEDRRRLLRVAVERHTALATAAADGDGCDRHLLGLQIQAAEAGLDPPEIFTDPMWKRRSAGVSENGNGDVRKEFKAVCGGQEFNAVCGGQETQSIIVDFCFNNFQLMPHARGCDV